MRPGRIHPGKGWGPDHAAAADRASMRPGRIHPGKPAGPGRYRSRPGRFNEAGADPPRKVENAIDAVFTSEEELQ